MSRNEKKDGGKIVTSFLPGQSAFQKMARQPCRRASSLSPFSHSRNQRSPRQNNKKPSRDGLRKSAAIQAHFALRIGILNRSLNQEPMNNWPRVHGMSMPASAPRFGPWLGLTALIIDSRAAWADETDAAKEKTAGPKSVLTIKPNDKTWHGGYSRPFNAALMASNVTGNTRSPRCSDADGGGESMTSNAMILLQLSIGWQAMPASA